MPATTLPDALSAQGLRKNYGERIAVADVSLHVRSGEVLGLLGPNGAGKSTTIAMICGLTPPDAGQVTVGGSTFAQDDAACKRRIGLVPQDIALFEDLPAQTNIELFGALYGLPKALLKERAATVLAVVGLSDRARDKPATFSGGMKRRLNIACALVHDPDVLLLDEPTAGVDPQSRNAIFDTLLALKAAGKALVYTTHYMEEVERLADRVVIIDHGKVVARGTLPELYALLPASQKLTLDLVGSGGGADSAGSADSVGGAGSAGGAGGASDADGAAVDAAKVAALTTLLQRVPGVRSVGHDNGRWQLGVDDLTLGTVAVLQALAAGGHAVRHIASGRANLEDVFLSLTGHQLRD